MVDKTKLLQLAAMIGQNHAYEGKLLLELYAELFLVAPPPPPPPVIDPPPPPVGVEPQDFGCPGDAELQRIPFKQVEGWWPNDPRKDNAVVTDFEVYDADPTKQADNDRGLLSGLADSIDNLTFRRGRAVRLSWWAANGHAKGLAFEEVSFLGTLGEHDFYPKLCGGGTGYRVLNCYSHLTGSQIFQAARRQWEMSAEHWAAAPGPIVLDGWLAVDHARHPAEGGKGTRRSQAFKVFSQQAGTKANQHDEQVPTTVRFRRLTLDDSMQGLSMGGLFLGDYLSIVVEESVFASGVLESHHTIDHGKGPVEIRPCEFRSKSGEGGRGVRLRSLTRPVMIHPGAGNLRIYGPSGEVLSHITDGYAQHWTGGAP